MNEILIYDVIGEGDSTAHSVRKQLSTMTGKVTVRISSPGGDAYQGVAIMNALRNYPGHVTTIVDGVAASAASYIAIGGGTTVLMAPHSELMIHEAFRAANGNATQLEKMAADLDRVSANIASIYADKAGGTRDQWRTLMKEETWFSAREAVEAGLANGIDRHSAAVAHNDTKVYALAQNYRYTGRDDAPEPNINRIGRNRAMGIFDSFARNEEQPNQETSPSFTEEQWAELTELLNLDAATATIDDVLATVKDIIEAGKQLSEEKQDSATMSFLNHAAEAPVTVDRRVWREMQDAIHRGVTARDQDDRLAAEQVVNQAIRIGKVSPSQREGWIKRYLDDPAGAVRAMNRREEIPRVELGHGRAPAWDKDETPQGWVR
ncbi:head maturation protease, ClpP-related [Corynebacterium macclintockiae]|uniref:head maturation protease, ClpP-related n=1 Tax=Corynebacterium macclintockiae TaxID=2913501 RepID=UPI003EB78482